MCDVVYNLEVKEKKHFIEVNGITDETTCYKGTDSKLTQKSLHWGLDLVLFKAAMQVAKEEK